MACHIKTFSAIDDVQDIRRKLNPGWTERFEDGTNETAWEDMDWTWKDDDKSIEEKKSETSYFQHCLLAISPVGDMMVIADGNNAVFLNKKWDNNEEGNIKEKFLPSTYERLADSEEEYVTCIICLPLASQKRSAYGRPDWTAVVIGFSTGCVKIYTENGILLMSQKFHEESVSSIKCRTFEHPRHTALAEQQEELVIFYKKVVVTIDGFSMYQTLRACRNQVAKATAYKSESVTTPPIAYKKWGFVDHEIIEDCESVGISYSNFFDGMMLKSVSRGYHGISNSTTSTSTLFIATGKSPYISFYYAMEEGAPSLVMEVAMAAAHKLVSLFTGVFGLRSQSAADKKLHPKIEPSSPLCSRFQLRDSSRIGRCISISPGRRLSVVNDDFGRVVLVDNKNGIAIRFWKGYRDAQCSWIEVEEDSHSSENKGADDSLSTRVALFLVIYCSRRGILEIWAMQQGPRVAAFNVGKNACLASCDHGILGLSNVQSVIKGRAQTYNCFLIDADGQVKTISVPFHYILSAKHSKRAQDIHLLNNLKVILKDRQKDEATLMNEIPALILDIKTAVVRQQALEAVIHHKGENFQLLKIMVQRLTKSLKAQDPNSLDLESKLLGISVSCQQKLLELYEGLNFALVAKRSSEYQDSDLDHEKPLQALSAMLQLNESELDELFGRVDKYVSIILSQKSVHFGNHMATLSPGKFLSCFQTHCYHLPKHDTSLSCPSEHAMSQISLEVLDRDTLLSLSHTLYNAAIQGHINLVNFKAILLQSKIDCQLLMMLLMEYWLQLEKHLGEWHVLRNLYDICSFLSSEIDSAKVIADYNEVSPWWSAIRSTLSKTPNCIGAFTAALVCRGVAVTIAFGHRTNILVDTAAQSKHEDSDTNGNMCDTSATTSEKSKSQATDTSVKVDHTEDIQNSSSTMDVSLTEWEGVDLDTEEWNLLVKQLEDVIVLSTLLKYKIPPFLSNKYIDDITEQQPITVASLAAKGRGVVSELVAIWTTRLNIERIIELVDPTTNKLVGSVETEEAEEVITQGLQLQINALKGIFEDTKTHFPYSLNAEVLLANCCWEFCASWNKNKDYIVNLQNAVICLKRISTSRWCKGLASSLWHTFMKQSFASAAYLIEKVGKLPKERLCRKDVNMTDISLEKFVDSCVKVLEVLLKVCSSRETITVTQFHCEDPWQNSSGPFPLVDLIAMQKEPSYLLVCHHYKLAMTMHLIIAFRMKSSKPLSMFDSVNRNALFKDFHSNIFISDKTPDLSIVNSRLQFLQRAISAVVQSIPEPVFENDIENGMSLVTVTERFNLNAWIGKIMELGSLWESDSDSLYRHYICELYSTGLDSLAEEILPVVIDRELMGSQLILIAGQRIYNSILDAGEKYVQKLALFPPTITTWLTTLNQNPLRCPNPPLTLTAALISYVINVIPDNLSLHSMAVSLVEPLHQLLNSDGACKNENDLVS